MKRLLFVFSLIIFLPLLFSSKVFAATDCESKLQCESKKEDESSYNTCLQKEKECWQNNISEAQGQSNTLNSAISILNGQIRVQSVKIQQTRNEIGQLEEEITELDQRITGLGLSLNHFSGILINRIVENYKQSRTIYKTDFFGSDSFNDFISKERYLSLAQEQTIDLMKKAELQRLDYNQQKELKEEKQREVELKQRELQGQKVELDSQKNSKNQLLSETKNSEAVYQQKVAELNAQLASFSRFASNIGISLLGNQTRCNDWGCYYSQRDQQWGAMYLGSSGYTLASSGCLVTSVAMVASHYGKNVTPITIGSSSSPFAGGDLRYTISVPEATITRSPICSSSSCLDSALSEGKPVIVRLRAANSAGTHFIVILKKEGDKYIMHDPAIANGGNLSFTDHYSLAIISRVDKVSVY